VAADEDRRNCGLQILDMFFGAEEAMAKKVVVVKNGGKC